jgi:hypothetical protein
MIVSHDQTPVRAIFTDLCALLAEEGGHGFGVVQRRMDTRERGAAKIAENLAAADRMKKEAMHLLCPWRDRTNLNVH